MLVGRRIGENRVGNPAVGYFIVPHFDRHRRDRRHRLNALDIDFRELFDKSQDGVELALQILHFVVRDRDPREMGNAADGIGIDGHSRNSGSGPGVSIL